MDHRRLSAAYSIAAAFILSAVCQAQIQGPSAVGFGELVVLTSDSSGATQWEASDPGDLRLEATASGGVAFSSGCHATTITVRCYAIDWEAKTFSVDKITVTVGGPTPSPDLKGIAAIAHNSFADSSAALKLQLPAVANNFADIASKAAALSDWTAESLIAAVNSANSDLLKVAGAWKEADEIYRGMLAEAIRSENIDVADKSKVIAAYIEIAAGIRAVE